MTGMIVPHRVSQTPAGPPFIVARVRGRDSARLHRIAMQRDMRPRVYLLFSLAGLTTRTRREPSVHT